MITSSRKFTVLSLSTVLLLCFCSCQPSESSQQSASTAPQIHLNQIGYYPDAPKKVIVIGIATKGKARLLDAASGATLAEYALSDEYNWEMAGDKVRVVDFSDWKKEGTYLIELEDSIRSGTFRIGPNVLKEVFEGSVKGLYFQRAGMALEEQYAGQWKRPAGHPDTALLFHPSSGKTEGRWSSPKGWYDAGDFNKYVVNASFPLGQLLSLHEQYPALLPDNSLNIPESGNGRSDYLDELKYELDWILSMQDADGGLFHKLTCLNFEGVLMPHEATNQRYIVGKGTAATLDFAGASAQAYRVFGELDPAYATRCLKAAEAAWNWAEQHSDIAFKNPEDVSTGEYGDNDFTAEFYWAAAELYTSTGKEIYLDYLKNNPPTIDFETDEGWRGFMSTLGVFTLLEQATELPQDMKASLQSALLAEADGLVAKVRSTDYFQPVDRFVWGSNSDLMNAAMMMAVAYRQQPKQEYLTAICETTDYILGKNPLGVCYVTGFGTKPPMFIHHRQSMADGIADPVPGLLSGGPNFMQQDTAHGTVYPADVPPMKSWVDQESSYASNEICLNWNAPLTYVLGFLEAEAQ